MTNTQHDDRRHERRASPIGAYITALGAIVLLISVWLHWAATGRGDAHGHDWSGYESDGVIPLMGYLALGFAIALLYATVRADRRQHRGLSLASFAAGLASLLWSVSFLIDPIATAQYDENVSVGVGPWIGALGALLWAVGSFLLAKEPEGDFEPTHTAVAARPVTTHTEPGHVAADAHHGTAHTEGYGSTHTTGAAGTPTRGTGTYVEGEDPLRGQGRGSR